MAILLCTCEIATQSGCHLLRSHMCVGSSGDMFFAQETIVDGTVHRVSPISHIRLSSKTVQLDSMSFGKSEEMTFRTLL